MKKFILFVLTASLVLGGMSSCNDSKNEFYIYPAISYVVQDHTGFYKPVMYFYYNYGTLEKGSISKDGIPMSAQSLPTFNLYEIYSDRASASSLSMLNGTYVMSAQDTEGYVSSVDFVLKLDKEIGDFEYTDFAFSNGEIKYTVTEPVENASSYALYFYHVYKEISSDALCANFSKYEVQVKKEADQKVAFEYDSTLIPSDCEYVLVYPMAGYSTNTGTLIKLGKPERLYKGASSFDGEDAEKN